MFKESFKYYKSRKDPPDLSTVIDLDASDLLSAPAVRPFALSAEAIRTLPTRADCLPPTEWRCFELLDRPGLLIVRNPFTARGQRYWMARCMRDYPRHPHAVNLTSQRSVSPEAVRDWWRALQALPTGTDKLRLRSAMRWTTLGYHHNWDTKQYTEGARHAFPGDLAELSRYIGQLLGFGDAYRAEAAIVNFYPQGTTLAGHTDHSERVLDAPLFSISFGQTAIFLIGGRSVNVRPAAVFLRSGDIAVMSRESRLSYHAVPRIMHGAEECAWSMVASDDCDAIEPHAKRKRTESASADGIEEQQLHGLEAELWQGIADDRDEWRPFGEYVRECRININVRQVLPDGAKVLDDCPDAIE